jgi:DNA (cytosine-5)-methyltransferase 1
MPQKRSKARKRADKRFKKIMKHLGLFEGIGGFSLAAKWMNWQTVAWCEWNEFNQKVLKHHFPEAIGHGDITKTDFTLYANKIDILTGGFPCQPYSTAGKRKGKEDERHLWPEMLRAIREVKPRWIVGENVRGLINWNGGMVFNEVQIDLEAEGYEVIPFLLPACAVNAPHRRDRIWIIAIAKGSNGWDLRGYESRKGRENAEDCEHSHTGGYGNVTHAEKQRLEKRNGERAQFRTYATVERYNGVSCWDNFPTQSPVCSRNDGFSGRLDLGAISFSKWRTESIKSAGNAIVPQVAYEIFKAIQAFDE